MKSLIFEQFSNLISNILMSTYFYQGHIAIKLLAVRINNNAVILPLKQRS